MRFPPLLALAFSAMLLGFGATSGTAQAPPSESAPRGAVTAPPALAQAAPPPANPAPAPRYAGASQIPATGQRITLEVNKGTLIRLSAAAATVFVANPDIADVQVKSPTFIYITAKAPGETVIYAVDASDAVLLNAPILVQHDVSRLRSSLRQLAPGEQISADSVDGNLVLTGVASDAGQADRVSKLAASIAGEVKGSAVINRMTVATPNQVSLRVKVAEVEVSKLNEIGVNWSKAFGVPSSSVQFLTTNPV
ncbi:MAG: pilus assembly protein N-terminal domain-containing protein, partial [Alphaproteobacteria bacterium]|nr:pilus assembly protein N-terminal domain-containing protein [Alphaproteobacteria bacterium]